MTPFLDKKPIVDFGTSKLILDANQLEPVWECVWSDDEGLQVASEVSDKFPSSQYDLSHSKFRYRLRRVLISVDLIPYLKPTEYFSLQGEKYMRAGQGTTPLRTMLEGRRPQISMIRDSHYMPKASNQRLSTDKCKDDIKAIETILTDPQLIKTMEDVSIMKLKNNLLKLSQKLEFLEAEENYPTERIF